MVIITPAMNVGHTVDSAVVQTERLCDTGFTYPASVVREMMDGALKAVHEDLVHHHLPILHHLQHRLHLTTCLMS